ncbi:MAG: CmcI family methyltransferase [Planctomycetota bacterium]
MIHINPETGTIRVEEAGKVSEIGLGTPDGFRLLTKLWLRSGWDTKYVYGFSWLGRPIIQLPDDLVRIQDSLVCFIINLVLQTEFASNGNEALTDKQAREILNIGVAFSDTQSARQGRAAKAKWVSIGKKTIKIKKSGTLRVSLPISKRGRALLKRAPLKVRVTYTLTRGANERRIVKFVTLPRIAS